MAILLKATVDRNKTVAFRERKMRVQGNNDISLVQIYRQASTPPPRESRFRSTACCRSPSGHDGKAEYLSCSAKMMLK